MTVHQQRAMTPQDITRLRFVSDPQLSPDGRRVAFVVTMLSEDRDESLSNIWVVDPAGGEPRRFTTGPRRDTTPRWSPDGTRLAFVSEREAQQKAQLYVLPAHGGEPMRLTSLPNGVTHPVWSPDSTRVALVSRVGGWQEPEDEAERQKSKPARLITTLKYKYNAVHGDWGGGDFADVMAGVDEALRQCHFIDPERLGVMGGSYGGFLTSWTVGHTQRFKAACSERAVNNVATLFGTSDIGVAFLEAQSGALPWDNPQWYIAHSPLTYAQHITTPLLILHAEDDLRCPMEQAEQLFAVLRRRRQEVLFVRFPDENHEMSRAGKPRHRLERYRYILDWFARYLL